MARARLLQDVITGERYFRHSVTDMMFRRIVGALAWPCGEKPGSVVVLGETRSRQDVLGGRHDVHCLDEFRSDDVGELLVRMGHMGEDWLVKFWATPISDPRVYLLEDMRDEQRRVRRLAVRYGDPQSWKGQGEGLLPFYHALVQRRTRSEKSLFLGGDCSGADEIGKLMEEDISKKPTDLPGAAAIFFALAEIDVNTMPEWGESRKLDGGPADELGGY